MILALLFAASFVAYVLRTNMSIAGDSIMADLGLSEIQLGMVFSAFAWGYAIFQFPDGNFLSTDHTLRHFRECWYPSIIDRDTYQSWTAAGQPMAIEKARQAARDAIANHTPEPLGQATVGKLHGIVAAADERTGIS